MFEKKCVVFQTHILTGAAFNFLTKYVFIILSLFVGLILHITEASANP